MLQSTHIHVARLLEDRLTIEDRSLYYVGASVPDARYFAGIDRERTHFPRSEIIETFGSDANRSFLAGYDVHLALDEFTIATRIIEEIPKMYRFPVNRCISRPIVEVMFALYSIEEMAGEGELDVSWEYPDVVGLIGIEKKPFEEFFRAVAATVQTGTIKGFSDEMMKQERFKKNHRLMKLLRTSVFIEKHPVIKSRLFARSRPMIREFIDTFVKDYVPQV
jgi:hypothetical protein